MLSEASCVQGFVNRVLFPYIPVVNELAGDGGLD